MQCQYSPATYLLQRRAARRLYTVIDPVLMGPSAGGSGPAPVVGGGDPNRVRTFSPLFPADLVFDLLFSLL